MDNTYKETFLEHNKHQECHEQGNKELLDRTNSPNNLGHRKREAHKLHHWHNKLLLRIHNQHDQHGDQQLQEEQGQHRHQHQLVIEMQEEVEAKEEISFCDLK